MQFHKGLNVIIGANNSGKTGLLNAINLLNSPSSISVDDFNKNNLLRFDVLYHDLAPSIVIEYEIEHEIAEDDTDDESIIRLLPFLGLKEFEKTRQERDGIAKYHIKALIRATYSLDEKFLSAYKKVVQDEVKGFETYLTVLKRFVENHYVWTYTNGISDIKSDQKTVTQIFDIRFIGAERTSEEVKKEIKREIVAFARDENNQGKFDEFNHDISEGIQELLAPSMQRLSELFANEKNEIGLAKGNVSIASTIKVDLPFAESYVTEIEDTRKGYKLPLQHNGLGYNNLINIYMLIKLSDIRLGKDFRILCLEEPEAHLHPAMQYKLFKYLKELDLRDNLNQQIFVTTHSSNISAVAGLDNMFMLAYDRNSKTPDCFQQSLKEQFTDKEDVDNKAKAKDHLSKFLDVTRSDMLFSDKVILVEGIAEKLMMPLFMEICHCSFEDEHISIVDIGGKHFEHFVELFNGNVVRKKVLCITDKDFQWVSFDGMSQTYEKYREFVPNHIIKLKERFPIDNFHICTQCNGGRTFEDEFFIDNFGDKAVAATIFKHAIGGSVRKFFDEYEFNCGSWIEFAEEKLHQKSFQAIKRFLQEYKMRLADSAENKLFYEKLMFAEIFLKYAEKGKGDLALQLLTDPELISDGGKSKLIVPRYIREGLEWLRM